MLEQDEYFSAVELGLEGLNPHVYCNISEHADDAGEPTGKMLAILTVQEDFRFHRELDESVTKDAEDRMFSEDGQPKEAVLIALQKLIEERYKGEDFQTDDSGSEWFQFDLVLVVDPEQEAGDLGGKFWEETALVQFHNEADPGTYGSDYLFGSLVYDGLRELEQ